MKTNVIVNLNIQGIHQWKECFLKTVKFLKNAHRHVFYITCKKEVSHDDRDIEIIMLKNEILTYLNKKYYVEELGMATFGNMSCEMIAKMLLERFNLNYCKVLEDNENGAEVRI